MGKILATYAVNVTIRQPDDAPDDAEAPPTVGARNTDDVVDAFIPTAELLADVVGQALSQATQLPVSASATWTSK